MLAKREEISKRACWSGRLEIAPMLKSLWINENNRREIKIWLKGRRRKSHFTRCQPAALYNRFCHNRLLCITLSLEIYLLQIFSTHHDRLLSCVLYYAENLENGYWRELKKKFSVKLFRGSRISWLIDRVLDTSRDQNLRFNQ